MWMFPLAMSCLTMSKLSWFMDLTFQVSMQYYSLQHRTLLSPSDTSTTGHGLWYGLASSFLLKLFLCSSPLAYGHLLTWGVHFAVSNLFAFSYCSWGSQGENAEVFNSYAEYIMWNVRLDEAQAEIKIPRRNINNLRNADDTTLKAESEEELKGLLMKSERGEQKSWLKAQHSKN